MKNYNIILFDLDGTLTDTGLGITNAVAYALEKYNIKVAERSELYSFIGPPLAESFQIFLKKYNILETDGKKAVEFYREYYRDKGIFEFEVYGGMEQILQQLKDAGKTLVVATSKPEVFARKILAHAKIDTFFTYIAGAKLDGSRTNKHEVIQYALSSIGHSNLSEVLMIGDRKHDILGAKKVGIDSMGVLYGYGDLDELSSAGATYIAPEVCDITKIILSEK